MTARDDALQQKLLQTFALEAREHLDAISAGLLALEQGPLPARRQELVEATFREVHTLKGAARAVNLLAAVEICHALESIFAALKRHEQEVSTGLLDLLHEGFARVKNLLPGGAPSGPDVSAPQHAALLERLGTACQGLQSGADFSAPAAPAVPAEPPRPTPARETLRLATAKLDTLMLQAEELVAAKLAATKREAELSALIEAFDARMKARLRRRRSAAEGGDAQWLELSDQDGQNFRWLANQLKALSATAQHDLRTFSKTLDNLLEGTKQIMMVPFSTLFEPLPQLVRDISRAQGKETDFVIEGDDLESDRRIQEEMKDTLLHLIRNAVDHGIEPVAERRAKAKPPRGRIGIAITQRESGRAEIVISDDGAGIDLSRVRQAARKLGLAPGGEDEGRGNGEGKGEEEDAALLKLIFRSGLSTSKVLTELSGRGLGLAIVQEKMEKLGGTISVTSKPGQGTTFRILLPLVLASFRGILVELGGAIFVLPTRHVERVARIPAADITTVENRETFRLGPRTLSLVWLRDLLDLPAPPDPTHKPQGAFHPVVVLNWAGESIAFVVDAVCDECEVLMKGLGRQLPRVRNVAGASLLASGAIALILDVPDLMKSAVTSPAQTRAAQAAQVRKSILVAEDSITARTLFKHVLEAAGYRVKTAADGADAWTSLANEPFDLLVSDVEMPRLDGFQLTSKIRTSPKLEKLPVILITSLGSREDRERGIDAGASAYIVKDNFDQNTLLRLVDHLT